MTENYQNFAVELAKKAGQIMLDNFSLGIKKEWKSDHTPLTIADTAINNLVIKTIQESYPEHGVVGEEASSPKLDAEYIWVCDPIDGTIPFSHGIPFSTFSLALTHKGTPVLGVVYDPFLNRLFFAEKNKGAYLNNGKISVSNSSQLSHTTMIIDILDTKLFDAFAVWKKLMEKNVKVISLASHVEVGMLIACGEISGAIFGGLKPWDVAAVKIIVEEAGGKCTNVFGREQEYDREIQGAITTNNLLHSELIGIIQNTIPDRL